MMKNAHGSTAIVTQNLCHNYVSTGGKVETKTSRLI